MDALDALVRPAARAGSAADGVTLVSIADLPTRHGHFRVAAFRDATDGKEHVALVRGEVVGAELVPVRLHSECLTGDALGSLRCDCREQLEAAQAYLGRQERGVLLYLRQEGRGIGLTNKLKAYALQDAGLDTVDANLALGFRSDERDYRVAAEMLRILQVRSIRLLTNNPDKVDQLRRYGVKVAERVPHEMPPNRRNVDYLRTKVNRSGHLLELTDARKAGK